MNITKQQWEKIGTIVLSATIAILAVLGWVIGPIAPADSPAVEQRAVERIGILCAGEAGNCVEGWNGSGIAIYSDAGSTSKFSVTGSTGATTIASGLTVSAGTVSLPASEIGTTEIANITRTVSIPLQSFIECTTDAGAAINFSSGADASPDFINSSTNGLGFTLTFDATGGSVDTEYVCANLRVPADYASNGLFVVNATKGAETGANSEVLNCAGSINGAALGSGGTATLSGTAAASYTCAPTLTSLAAGDAVSFEFHITSGGTADDAVNLLAVAFEYLATQ